MGYTFNAGPNAVLLVLKQHAAQVQSTRSQPQDRPITLNATPPHHATPQHTTPRRVTPHHTTPHHTTPRHTTPRHTTPRHTTPRHTTPHHTSTTPHLTTPSHTTPHHTTLHQRECLPAAILGRRDVCGAAETGSGKTLAYGLPILQRILQLQDAGTPPEGAAKPTPIPYSPEWTSILQAWAPAYEYCFCSRKPIGCALDSVSQTKACCSEKACVLRPPLIVITDAQRLLTAAHTAHAHPLSI